jgi:PKD repeat protein
LIYLHQIEMNYSPKGGRCRNQYSAYNILLHMIKQIFILVIISFFFYTANSQISVHGIPESFSIKTKKAVVIPSKTLNAIDTTKLIIEDKMNGVPNRYGIVQQIEIDIKAEGAKTEVAGKGYLWQYQVNSVQATSLGITFSKFLLPGGASVFIYNQTHSQLLGAFTSQNNNGINQLAIADLNSQNAIIEYFEPYNPAFSGQLTIGSVTQGYKNVLKAGSTRVGINCPEGANWQDVKHAVCRMTFHDTQYGYYCTGFLVNNVREDGTPYFQTANHCISTSSEAATLVTYFNYENSTCTSSDAPLNQTLSGAVLKATNNYSDFTLLLLNEYPPVSYLPYFAGWDASTRAPQKGTCIHHPSGLAKCIALANNPPVTNSGLLQWTDGSNVVTSTSPINTHWDAQFNVGATEAGSSGSPLFDDNKRAIGQLHGGTTTDNYFGKFSLSWNYSPSGSAQLKSWLDPDNTGTLSMDGFFSTQKPQALFSTNLTAVCPGSTIKFTDNSKYNPTAWNWDIQPSSFSFVNGTTKNSRNPEITFNTAGNYTVSLTVSNTNGTDQLTKTDYIHSGNLLVKLSGITSDSIICGCNLINFPLGASGASNYIFSIERPDKINYTVLSDSIYLSLISAEKKNGSFNSWIKVTGIQGTCSSTDSLEMKISMPVNDDIANAVRLSPGRNTGFTNFCASAETNEAAPPSTTLKNTIWFKFQAPSSGLINIDTHGFNDRIAVYDASSYLNLISGNSSSYKLVASNDDRSSSDNTALISKLAVDPYKIYWLQLDGSGGATGSCVIDLLSNSLELYPNPSSGEINVIISNNNDGNAEVQVVSVSGKVLYSNVFGVTKENNSFKFNLSPYSAGLYFLVVRINGSTMRTKLLLK